MIHRLLSLIRRNQRAYQFGIQYGRGTRFNIPTTLLINRKRKIISLPRDNGTKVAFVDLLLDDCYGIKTFSEPVSTILDIGGHAGIFGLAARCQFPYAIIHTYEPNPNLKKYLQVQAEAAGFSYFMEAVGLEDGTVSLDIQEDSVLTKVYNNANGEISQVSFRNAINKFNTPIDLVKLDCEGAEWQIFQDWDAWQSVKHLTMEYHLWPKFSHDHAAIVIQQLGFKLVRQLRSHQFDGIIIASRQY